jgi:Tol biopolymer transport system component
MRPPRSASRPHPSAAGAAAPLLAAALAVSTGARAAEPQRSRLMTIALDGSDPRLAHETTDHIEAPNWTRDGKTLIFNAAGRLYRIPVAGGAAPAPIDTGAVTGINNDHGLAPDGKTIIFSARGHIYTVPLAGGVPARVSTDEGEGAGLVYWWHGVSPDGRTLAFCGQRGDAKDIWVIPRKGGAPRRLDDHPAADDGPDYSPDGRWIYFNSDRSGTNQIWRLPARGGRPERLTNDDRSNWFPHPSPDGRWVVYLSYPPGTEGHPRDRHVILRRMRPDGREIRDVRKLFGGQGTINVPSWSPDGKRFAFVEYTEPPAAAPAAAPR